jgi:hypothetical protein
VLNIKPTEPEKDFLHSRFYSSHHLVRFEMHHLATAGGVGVGL